jgi:UDP-N-acetyl-D-mannosaminuronic acid dehydrogenase
VRYDLCVVGGAGHVGLPLALAFAESGLNVLIQDRNAAALEQIAGGRLPFSEDGGEPLLADVVRQGRLHTTTRIEAMADTEAIVVTIGTPVDEFLNPEMNVIRQWADEAYPVLRDDQLVVLRSTLYPGTTQWLADYLHRRGRSPMLAFCPERIAQGKALQELKSLPQLVSGVTPAATEAAERLFARIAPETLRLSCMEAEFAKLFTNAYRYISFGIANQFFMLADRAGLDFDRIWHCCRHNYPRMANVPTPGFTAGPCLFKDTMQLAAFNNHEFGLGHSAMLVNEGLPRYLVDRVKQTHDLSRMTTGILGMAFKADVDDTRASLSYKLKKVLELECPHVLCADPYVRDVSLVPQAQVLAEADVIFVATPHTVYRSLAMPAKAHVIDIWNVLPARPAE